MSQFPHPDIEDEGPKVTDYMSRFTREDDRYWKNPPSDHYDEGLFASATEGENDTLAGLIGYGHCPISAPTPEGERRRHVVNKSRRVSNGGRFGRPVKPANSGRKKRAA